MIDAKSGMAVTNAHVVAGLAATKARFADGSVSPLHVMAIDPCSDLAAVHISTPPTSLSALGLGDEASLSAGDQVTVLGYPASAADFTTEKMAITSGLVQGTKVDANPGADLPEYPDTVQHGATVNPGNSGGPLLDEHGTVVGINTLSATGDVQGQFYSIGVTAALKKKIGDLMSGKSQNDVGWALKPPAEGLDDALQQQVKAAGEVGMVVMDVDAGSAAERAGLARGDLITSIQSASTPGMKQVCDVLESVLPGTTIRVEGIALTGTNAGQAFTAEFATPGSH